MHIRFFDAHLEGFIHSLDEATVAKVLRTIDLLKMFGHNLTLPHSKKVRSNLFELRIPGKQSIRIFYAFHRGGAVLLHDFVKKSERIPQKELRTALHKLKTLDAL